MIFPLAYIILIVVAKQRHHIWLQVGGKSALCNIVSFIDRMRRSIEFRCRIF